MELGIEQPPAANIYLINTNFLDDNCIDYQMTQYIKNEVLDEKMKIKLMANVTNLTREGQWLLS